MNSPLKAMEKASLETVTDVRVWRQGLITFTTTRPPGYAFSAGQYARLGLQDDKGIIWRAFSMTSAPGDAGLEFYGVIVPGGLFTTLLDRVKPGDPIWIEKQPYGFLTPDRFTDGEELWMLSTGTGVGPFISMLRSSEVWRQFRRLNLVHGVRHADELTYREEIEALRRRHEAQGTELRIIRATTRDVPVAAPDIVHGRITTLLESGELERQAGTSLSAEHSRLMMCGNPDMIEEVRRLLHQRGMRPVRRATPGQFVTENYW